MYGIYCMRLGKRAPESWHHNLLIRSPQGSDFRVLNMNNADFLEVSSRELVNGPAAQALTASFEIRVGAMDQAP